MINKLLFFYFQVRGVQRAHLLEVYAEVVFKECVYFLALLDV